MMRFLLLTALICTLALPGAAGAETCVTAACHAGIGAVKNLHQPVRDAECLSCHQQAAREHPLKDGKSYPLAAKGAELCNRCHDPFGKKKLVHAPVQEGDCLSCHKAHGAKGRFLLDDGEDQGALCFGCHDSAPFAREYVHGPVAMGNCTACHDPHQSDAKSLLKRGSRELCLSCHSEFAKKMRAAAIIHPPVKNEPCVSCHDPHSAATRYLLKEKMPDLCVGCHAKIGKKLKGAKNIHKPILEGKLCGNCHSTHFSASKGLLAADEKSVCLGCHNTDQLGKPPLNNIKKELEGKNKQLHGPLEKGRCLGCHDPHASDFDNMFIGDYPPGFYAPYAQDSYDLCLQCHEKHLLRFPETTIYTKFRNGDRNLHYLHVVDGRKGRSCRACHVAHAGDGEKLTAKDGAVFGEWKVPSRLAITPTGGSCAPGCHRSVAYDREKPVTYER